MKQITLEISDGVFNKLRKLIYIQNVSGISHGIATEFINNIISSLSRGDEKLELKLKEE